MKWIIDNHRSYHINHMLSLINITGQKGCDSQKVLALSKQVKALYNERMQSQQAKIIMY